MTTSEARLATDPRISRRRRAVERSKRKRLLVSLGALLVVAGLIWVMFFSSALHVRSVKVVGSKHMEPAEIARAAGLDQAGRNLLLLPTAKVAAQVEDLPWVKSAEVDRMLPGTVRIRITERTPRVMLALGAARWTLDAEGHVLAAGEARPGLPVLAGVEVGEVEPGTRLMTEEATAALKVLRSLPKAVRSQVTALFAPTFERITLSLGEGPAIRYGAAEQIAAKNEVLTVLLKRLAAEGRSPAYIDVRVPGSPAVLDEGPAPTPPPVPAP